MSEELEPPQHDRQADEADLLTVREAAARLYEQAQAVRAEREALVAAGEGYDGIRVEALRAREEALDEAARRYDAHRRAPRRLPM